MGNQWCIFNLKVKQKHKTRGKKMKLTSKIKKDSEKTITIKSINDVPLKNMAGIIAKAKLKEQGFYSCTIDGVKTLIILA
jgi:hypothetical protein